MKFILIPLMLCGLISTSLYAQEPAVSLSKVKSVNQATTLKKTATPKPQFNTPVLLNKTIAIVNNNVITSTELTKAVQQAKAQLQGTQTVRPDLLTIQRQVLQQLILKRLAMQLAKRNNVKVSNMEVTQAINTILTENKTSLPALKSQLKTLGVSYKNYRENLKTQLTINKLQQKAVAGTIFISPKEINQYFEKHMHAQKISEYETQHILLPLPADHTPEANAKVKQEADKIVAKIKAKKITFSAAAAKYSQSGDALSGGKLGWKTPSELPGIFANKVENMKKGEILPPFQAGDNFHILYLVNKKQKLMQQHYINQFDVSQIVIKVTPVVSNEQAKAQLERITNDLKNGVSFSELAKSNSQNYDNANKGGDMGWVTLTTVPFKISKMIETTPAGRYSEPFQVDDTWQIIKVNKERKHNDTETYLKQQAANVLFQQKAQQAVKTWMVSLKNNAYIKILNPQLEMPKL
ncbi:peptidylprolyl isomerase [Francisellaceae bacterium]|nr:peptidylprolyl isomerase [Francisellaceae bacterium]